MGIIQDNEIYMNDDRLCFMFSLLKNNGAKIICANKYLADNFKNNFEIFVSEVFETYIQTLPKHKQEQIIDELSDYDDERIPYEYNDWYTITYSEEIKELSITLKENGLLLDNTLRRYAQNHWEDDLRTWNNVNHYCSEKICRDFYTQILDYNCKDLYLDDTNSIHAIVLGYYKGYIEVNSIECSIDLSAIDSLLFMPCGIEYPTNLVTNFKCNINANLFKHNFEKLIKKPNIKTTQNNSRVKYPPQQQYIYDLIVKCIGETGKYIIQEDELRRGLGLKYCDKDTNVLYNATKEFNKCYREINNINDNKVKILSKQRGEYYYNISKNFKV